MSEDDKDKILDQESGQNNSDQNQSQDEKPVVEDSDQNQNNENNTEELTNTEKTQITEPEVVNENINLFENDKKKDENVGIEQSPETLDNQSSDNIDNQQNQTVETSNNEENNGKNKVIHKKDGRLHIYVRQDKYKGELKSKNWVGRIYIDGKQKIFSSEPKTWMKQYQY